VAVRVLWPHHEVGFYRDLQRNNTTGSDNNAMGMLALGNNTTGNYNTASGGWKASKRVRRRTGCGGSCRLS